MAENIENKVNENEEQIEVTVEKKLVALYTLQQIDTKIDKIRIVRGELPLEVQDLEDEIVGLQTRIENYNNELNIFFDLAYKAPIYSLSGLGSGMPAGDYSFSSFRIFCRASSVSKSFDLQNLSSSSERAVHFCSSSISYSLFCSLATIFSSSAIASA